MRDRAIAFGWIFLALQLALLAFLALRSHGAIGPGPDSSSTDYMMIYASGKLAQGGSPEAVYDLARQSAMQRQLFGAPMDGFFPFYYPPIYLIACVVLAQLPYFLGYAVWMILTGGAFLYLLRAVTRDWRIAIALCSFPAAIVNLGLGQNAFLTASLLTGGAFLLDGGPAIAGVLFGMLAFKPHFLVLVPLALLAGRRWRALVAMALTVVAVTALSVVLFGFGTWWAFIAHLPVAQAIYGGGRLGYWAQTSVFAAVRLLGGGYVTAFALHGIATLLAAAIVAYAWWKDFPLPLRAVALIAGTLLCVPINLSYDLLAAAGAVAFMCRDDFLPALRPWEMALIAADWLIAFAGRGIAEKTGVPLMPLVPISLLVIALARLGSDAKVRRHLSGSVSAA